MEKTCGHISVPDPPHKIPMPRDKWEPTNDKAMWNHCDNCKYQTTPWEELPCTYCVGSGEAWEPKEEPDPNAMTKVERHNVICEEIHHLYQAKNHDYGDSFGQSFKAWGLKAGIIRMEDKFNRLKTLTQTDEQKVNDESIRDTLIDLANYAIMTVLEMDGEKE